MTTKFQQIVNTLAPLKEDHILIINGGGEQTSSITFSYRWAKGLAPIVLLIYVELKGDISLKVNWSSYGAMPIGIAKRFDKAMTEAIRIAEDIEAIIAQPDEVVPA